MLFFTDYIYRFLTYYHYFVKLFKKIKQLGVASWFFIHSGSIWHINAREKIFLFLFFSGSIYGFAPKLLLPLELVRLVSQRQGEKNFEIFYHLCAGLSPELRRKFGLKEAQKYFYLNLVCHLLTFSNLFNTSW